MKHNSNIMSLVKLVHENVPQNHPLFINTSHVLVESNPPMKPMIFCTESTVKLVFPQLTVVLTSPITELQILASIQAIRNMLVR